MEISFEEKSQGTRLSIQAMNVEIPLMIYINSK